MFSFFLRFFSFFLVAFSWRGLFFSFLVVFPKFSPFFFDCVSFNFLFFPRFFTFGQVKGNARFGRSRHLCFRDCKVNLATLKLATKMVGRISVQLWVQITKRGRERLFCVPTGWRLHVNTSCAPATQWEKIYAVGHMR